MPRRKDSPLKRALLGGVEGLQQALQFLSRQALLEQSQQGTADRQRQQLAIRLGLDPNSSSEELAAAVRSQGQQQAASQRQSDVAGAVQDFADLSPSQILARQRATQGDTPESEALNSLVASNVLPNIQITPDERRQSFVSQPQPVPDLIGAAAEPGRTDPETGAHPSPEDLLGLLNRQLPGTQAGRDIERRTRGALAAEGQGLRRLPGGLAAPDELSLSPQERANIGTRADVTRLTPEERARIVEAEGRARARVAEETGGEDADPTSAQTRAAAFLLPAEDANTVASQLEEAALDDPFFLRAGITPNIARTEEFQRYQALLDNFVRNVVIAKSGAQFSAQELEATRDSLVPQIGDRPGTIQEKAQRRRVELDSLRQLAGPALPEQPQGAPGGGSASVPGPEASGEELLQFMDAGGDLSLLSDEQLRRLDSALPGGS